MPLTFSEEDWEAFWQADRAKTEAVCYPESFEEHCSWSSSLDRGWSRKIQLRDLWLEIEEYQVVEDLITHSKPSSWGPVSSFFIAGTAKNRHLGLTDENVELPGKNFLECIQSSVELDHYFAGEPVLRVRLGLEPNALSLFGENSTLPLELVPLSVGKTLPPFYRQGITTPDMQIVLHQILHCPYQGAIKQMYLEGKALELAALQFCQFAEADRSVSHRSVFKADEIERLYHAKEILMRQFEQPPSILSLARQVGLNDFKLKQGFRQIFGTTVFGYLREYRLEQARLLLAEGQLNVQQVARAIGYTHAGHFATTFKRKFGVNPKTYQSGLDETELEL